jgi:hypothetical protein
VLCLSFKSDTRQYVYSHMYTRAVNYRQNVGGTCEWNMSDLCVQTHRK